MNVKLLRKVKRHILEEPKRYWHTHWLRKVDEQARESGPDCGTTGCIAGWAYILANKIDPLTLTAENAQQLGVEQTIFFGAARLLGLTIPQADRLFAIDADGIDGWPRNFWNRYLKAKRPVTRAKIAAERIEHFIKTKGKE